MLGLEGFLGNLDQLGECIGIGDRHVGEDLAVESDPGLFEPVHELGVGQAADAGGRVDAGDPKAADFALLIATIAIDVLQ